MIWPRILLLGLACGIAMACRTAARRAPGGEPGPSIVTDSTQYTVHDVNGFYSANIGYSYTNRTGTTVSVNYCGKPGPVGIEKRVDGQWVGAYDPIVLACLTIPPFRLATGESYHGAFNFGAAQPGRNMMPVLEVDSVPGIYRLRWGLRRGPDPDATEASPVDAISNEFRLVLP